MAGQLFNDLEKSTSGIITINRDGVIQSVDRNAAQLFGYTLGELLNEKINIIIPPPYKEQHDSYIQNYHRTGQKKIINTTRYVEGQHKSGTVFRIRLSVNEVMNGQLYIGLIERADTDIASMTCDENGLITVCNSSCCKLFGYANTSQLIGKQITSLVVRSADDENYFTRYRDRAQALKGAYKSVQSGIGITQDGKIFELCLILEGVPSGINNQLLFRATVESVKNMEAVFTLDEDGTVISCNRHYVELLFGWSEDELVGKHIIKLVPGLYSSDSVSYNPSANSEEPASTSISTSAPVSASASTASVSASASLPLSNSVSLPGMICDGSSTTESAVDDDLEEQLQPHKRRKLTESGDAVNVYIPSSCPFSSSSDNHSSSNNHSSSSNQNAMSISGSASTSMSIPLTESGNGSSNGNKGQGSEDEMGNAIKLWSISGTRRVFVDHKDGTRLPVDFEVRRFSSSGVNRYAVQVRRVPGDLVTRRQSATLDGSSSGVFDIGEYTTGRTLGKGTYGVVREAIHKSTGQKVAIKTLQRDCMDAAEEERSMREIEIMAQLDHPNITKLFKVIHTPDRIHIVMEYSGGGELLEYVKSKNGLTEAESRILFKQLVSAVLYCHKHSIVHRDIKHKNILLTEDHDLKLIDFGLSNFVKAGELRSTFCGTPAYAAPEMILSHKYNGPEVDVWSIGVVLFAMRAKRFPFANVLDIINCTYTCPDDFSEDLRSLLSQIFVKEREKRITMENLLEHPWVKNYPDSKDFDHSSSSTSTQNQLTQSITSISPLSLSSSSTTNASDGNATVSPRPTDFLAHLSSAHSLGSSSGGGSALDSSSELDC